MKQKINQMIRRTPPKIKYFVKKTNAIINYALWKIFGKKGGARGVVDESKIGNVLVINLAYIGDVLATLPMIEFLSKSKKVDFVVNSLKEKSLKNKFTIRELLKENKSIRKIIVFEDEGKVLKQIKGKYDLAIVISQSSKEISDLLIRANIPIRVAFCSHTSLKANFGFTDLVFPELERIPKVKENFKVIGTLKDMPKEINPTKFPIKVPITNKERSLAIKKFRLPKKFMLISPGSRGQMKQGVKLPRPETLAEVADILIEKYGEEIVILGAEWEKELAYKIIKNAKNKDKIKNLAGKTSIRESVAIINAARIIIGVDSGSMHIAASQNTKIVDLIRKGQERVWSPWIDSSKKRVLSSTKMERLDLIKSQEIIDAAKELLENKVSK